MKIQKMDNTPNTPSLSELQAIRNMMERSSRFTSLGGLSWLSAGCAAILGALAAYWFLDTLPFQHPHIVYYLQAYKSEKWGMNYITFFLVDAFATILLAGGLGTYFTYQRLQKEGESWHNPTVVRLFWSLMTPMLIGGAFCLTLWYQGAFALVAPATLVFYGLSLINASRYAYDYMRHLGLIMALLGLLGVVFIGYGLDLWFVGFGIVHVIFGAWLYRKIG